MMRCRICGAQHQISSEHCPECGKKPTECVGRCVPMHVPVPGYLTFDQLSGLATALDSQQAGQNDAQILAVKRSPSATAFAVSMKAVKWTGILVVCLTLALFAIVILKAFM